MPEFLHHTVFSDKDKERGLSQRQTEILLQLVEQALNMIEHPDDDRPKHLALMVFTRLGDDAEDSDRVATNIMTTMPKEWLHSLVRDWLHRETQ